MANSLWFSPDSQSSFLVYRRVKYNQHSVNSKKGTITWKCQSYGCTAKIVTKESKLIEIRGYHRNILHKAWTESQISKHEMEQTIIDKIKTQNQQPHQAFDSHIRDHPHQASIVTGFRDIRNKAYTAMYNSGNKLPKTAQEISTVLTKSGLDKNYWGQKIQLKDYDNATPKSLQEWRARTTYLYLGDDISAEYQVFCDKAGAETLQIARFLHLDVSFQFTPKISPTSKTSIPYKGGLHILATFSTKDAQHTNVTIPCATILFRAAKPDADTYDDAFKYLIIRCKEVHGIDIIPDEAVHVMADFEAALKIAIKRNWKVIYHHCLFHHGQALNTNLDDKHLKGLYQQNAKDFDFKFYCYIRRFHALPLLPPKLVPLAWNILSKQYKDCVPSAHQAKFKKWLMYHQKFWMKDGTFMGEWNCYRSSIRTNNSLETRNNLINKRFGSHPYLFKWIWFLSQWYADSQLQFEQYKIHGKGNLKSPRERLKELVLNKCWDFIDEHQSEKDILLFLERTSIALNSNTTVGALKRML